MCVDFFEETWEDGNRSQIQVLRSEEVGAKGASGLALLACQSGCTFSSTSAAVFLVTSRFSTKAVSPRKFPEAEERRDSRLSSKVLRVILKPFCCFVRSDCKHQARRSQVEMPQHLTLGQA